MYIIEHTRCTLKTLHYKKTLVLLYYSSTNKLCVNTSRY